MADIIAETIAMTTATRGRVATGCHRSTIVALMHGIAASIVAEKD
jgi:hypothetical protein